MIQTSITPRPEEAAAPCPASWCRSFRSLVVCGARANYLASDLQRQHRDVHAAAHQIHLSWEINGAEFGRIAAGLKPTNALL